MYPSFDVCAGRSLITHTMCMYVYHHFEGFTGVLSITVAADAAFAAIIIIFYIANVYKYTEHKYINICGIV